MGSPGSHGFGDGDLDPRVQRWARGLREPELGSDWSDVLARSHARRRAARRQLGVVVVSAVIALSAVGGAAFVLLEPSAAPARLQLASGGQPPAAGMVPSTSGPTDSASSAAAAADSTLVLYSGTPHTSFLRDTDDRARGLKLRTFEGFNARLPLVPARGAGPLAGDQESLTFTLYSDASLRTRSGSAFVSCLYGVAKSAFCNASIELRDGSTLTGTGVLEAGSLHFSFALTGGTGRFVSEEGAFEDVPTVNHDLELKFQFL